MTEARTVLLRLVVGATLYFTIVIAASALIPGRDYQIGEAQCFDDWCITVADADWRDDVGIATYEVTLELSNRARRMPMGERGTVVFLRDAAGHRYDPLPTDTDIPFDTVLQPGESRVTTRRFAVPEGTHGLTLTYAHEGGFPISWCVIGEPGWFQRPPVVRLDSHP